MLTKVKKVQVLLIMLKQKGQERSSSCRCCNGHAELHELTTSFVNEPDQEEQQFLLSVSLKETIQQATADAMKTTRARIKVLERRLRDQFMYSMSARLFNRLYAKPSRQAVNES